MAVDTKNYLSVQDAAIKWGISERSVRNYCSLGRVPGALYRGKTWSIPSEAQKPERKNKRTISQPLLAILKEERKNRIRNGIYHKIQIDFAYNSNRLEGNRLSYEQTKTIYETGTIGKADTMFRVNDILGIANHFRCVDKIIDSANSPLSENWIKRMDALTEMGVYRNEIDFDMKSEYITYEKDPSYDVSEQMRKLISEYNLKDRITIEDLLDLHAQFDFIHPFAHNIGRINRLILLKECLKNNIMPIIIDAKDWFIYGEGLKKWPGVKEPLYEACTSENSFFRKYAYYFNTHYDQERSGKQNG